MSGGVRIKHATMRSCLATVATSRPLTAPHDCPTCGRQHVVKTYHVSLDDAGVGIVSKEIWDRLKVVGGAGFSMVNHVARPPAQSVSVRSTLRMLGAEMTEAPTGVRVVHPSLRGERLVLVDADRPYSVPYVCQACGLVHTHKTYHLDLDGDGGVLVSREVADTLERLGMTPELEEPGPPVMAVTGA